MSSQAPKPLPSSFYRSVMAYIPEKSRVKLGKVKKPAPKGGGGGGKAKGIGGGKDGGNNDWVHIALEADVSDSHGDSPSFFDSHLKNLTRKQLSSLMRKIDDIASSALTESEEEALEVAKAEIEPLLTSSEELIGELKQRIQERLASLGSVELKELGRPMIRYGEVELRPRDFAKKHFDDIAADYDMQVQQRKIQPNAREKRGITFVRNVIVKLL